MQLDVTVREAAAKKGPTSKTPTGGELERKGREEKGRRRRESLAPAGMEKLSFREELASKIHRKVSVPFTVPVVLCTYTYAAFWKVVYYLFC